MKIISPKVLTLITTYKCTAACENCCFSCNPTYEKKMSFSEMEEYIRLSLKVFPSVEVVVFTGGECTILKDDLIKAIHYCNDLGLKTRIVSNGHWGTSIEKAKRYINLLTDNGLTELNISTGKDHLKYVPLSNIINIINAVSPNKRIKGLVISIEKRDDYEGENPIIQLKKEAARLAPQKDILVIESPWVNFRNRNTILNDGQLKHHFEGCKNLFSGIQINPNGQLLCCCGLACEYSPLLKLGRFDQKTLKKKYSAQFDDILKLWLYTDGPINILKQIHSKVEEECRHECDYCLELLTNKECIKKMLNIREDKAKEILLKYIIDQKTCKNE